MTKLTVAFRLKTNSRNAIVPPLSSAWCVSSCRDEVLFFYVSDTLLRINALMFTLLCRYRNSGTGNFPDGLQPTHQPALCKINIPWALSANDTQLGKSARQLKRTLKHKTCCASEKCVSHPFCCTTFKHLLLITSTASRPDGRNYKFERVWKETVVA
jgi:hypothetical protein